MTKRPRRGKKKMPRREEETGLSLGLPVLAAILGFVVIFIVMGGEQEEGDAGMGSNLFQQAPSFSGELLDGSMMSLEDYRGKIVVVNFWATWCPPCIKEMPALQEMHDAYPDVEVLGINMGESRDRVEEFLELRNISFPVLIDNGRELERLYNVVVKPSTFVVGPDGRIVDKKLGPITVEEFRKRLETARKEKI